MEPGRTKVPPLVAFLPIGAAFIAIGIGGNPAFVAIGCAFIAIGVAGVVRHRRLDREEVETSADELPDASRGKASAPRTSAAATARGP